MTGWPLSALEVHRHRLVPQRLRLCNDPVNEVAMAAPLRPLVPGADIKVDVLGKHSLVVLMENPSFKTLNTICVGFFKQSEMSGFSFSQIHFMSSLRHFYKDDFEMFLSLSSFQ